MPEQPRQVMTINWTVDPSGVAMEANNNQGGSGKPYLSRKGRGGWLRYGSSAGVVIMATTASPVWLNG